MGFFYNYASVRCLRCDSKYLQEMVKVAARLYSSMFCQSRPSLLLWQTREERKAMARSYSDQRKSLRNPRGFMKVKTYFIKFFFLFRMKTLHFFPYIYSILCSMKIDVQTFFFFLGRYGHLDSVQRSSREPHEKNTGLSSAFSRGCSLRVFSTQISPILSQLEEEEMA